MIDPLLQAQQQIDAVIMQETVEKPKVQPGERLNPKTPHRVIPMTILFSFLILLTIGLSFGMGYLLGSAKIKVGKILPQADYIEVPVGEIEQEKSSTISAASPKPQPTRSAVMKYPAPEAIRAAKEKQALDEIMSEQELSRDAGSFKL